MMHGHTYIKSALFCWLRHKTLYKQGPETLWTEISNRDLNIENAEKLHAHTSWCGSGEQNNDLLSRNCMSEMRPGSATDRQIGSDYGWKSRKTTEVFWKKKVAFRTNLEQMFKRAATDLDTQSTTTQQRMTCALKNSRLLPDGCCGLNDKGNEIFFRINVLPPLTMISG